MNLGDDANRLAAEARARVLIDRQLTDAGWSVQDSKSLNLFAAEGVARREATMATGHGRADYLLKSTLTRPLAVVEAKRFSIDSYSAKKQEFRTASRKVSCHRIKSTLRNRGSPSRARPERMTRLHSLIGAEPR